MTLEQRIREMLAESAKQDEQVLEAKACDMDDDKDEDEGDEVVINKKDKKDEACGKMKKEDTDVEEETSVVAEEANEDEVETKATVSEQVSALLSAEGLSEDFRVQAVAIFEAAVADRAMQIKEELEAEFEQKLNEEREALTANIDGYLSESVLAWASENKVELQQSFKSQMMESFMDGLRGLMIEHNIEVPEEKADALSLAMTDIEGLVEEVESKETTIAELQEQINEMKKEKILESFKSEMSATQADRFATLVESIKFENEEQYAKQLKVVKENFSVVKNDQKSLSESKEESSSAETKTVDSKVNLYAEFLTAKTIK